ncbi:FxsA family protein [Natranaerovirga pectinivora]|nr:FxsA family protein [Natranaerovirga pectinivora]
MKKQNIFTKLVLLFTVMPLVELYVLIEIASKTSWGYTILLVITTGIIGAYMAKSEGKQIISRIQNELSTGHLPGEELINGLCVLIGGALLLTPGILTDIIGFTLIIPVTRIIYKRWIREKFSNKIQRDTFIYEHKDF